MTVPSTSIKAGPFDGNDVATTFPFTFPCFSATDLRVVEAVIATGIETDLVLDSGYSVTLNADQEVSPGGSITYKVAGVTTPLPSTKTLVTLSNVGNTQPTSLPDGGAWRPKVVERALDRLTLQVKQIIEDLSRTFKVDVTSDSDVDTLLASVNAKAAEAVAAADVVTGVAADLADTTSATKGAGLLGFSSLLSYAAGTVGKFLVDLISSAGSSFVGFIQSGTGSIARTLQSKVREINVSAEDFGAVGDGTTDDSTALTNFWNSAIANPGVPHVLKRKTYAISATLPTINVSNVKILGAGARMRDSAGIEGTVIKWIGASGGTMLTISSVSGAGNYCLSGINLSGIGFDGNSGLAATGITIKSVKESDFNIVCSNFNTDNLIIDVVATLAEGRDTQKNRITYWGRNVEGDGANGVSLRLKGDSGANTSFNNFWVDIQHGDEPGIVVENADNNDWWMCRTYHGVGAATESISFLGGASAWVNARSERFHSLSTSLPVHAYGTGDYTVAASNISLLWNDEENATPEPIVDTGATIYWNKSNTPFGSYPWQVYTPTVTAGSGTFTAVSAVGYFQVRGKICNYKIDITVTTNGTAAGFVQASLWVPASGAIANVSTGKEIAVGFKSLSGFIGGAGTVVQIANYDGTYPAGDGYRLIVQGAYEIAQ